jgi:hypothetical protein
MGTIWYNGINGDSCTTRKRMETDPRWWIFSRFRSIHEFSTTSLGAESPTSFGFSVHSNWSTPAGGADASQLKFAMRRGWIKQNLDLQQIYYVDEHPFTINPNMMPIAIHASLCNLRHSRTAFERCLYWGQEVHTSSTTTSKDPSKTIQTFKHSKSIIQYHPKSIPKPSKCSIPKPSSRSPGSPSST